VSADLPPDLSRALDLILRGQEEAGAPSVLHHVAFAVSDIGMAARHWSALFGLGPFCQIADPDPAAPTPAFAWWGSLYVEFVPLRAGGDDAPRELTSSFHHLSYLTSAPAEEGERLAGRGLAKLSEMRRGPVWSQHYGGDQAVGCVIELHRSGPEMARFFGTVQDAALAWDGAETLIAIPPPGGEGH
jgi:Glyoxalase/Bleomycin resistance protein/Dioxygenase superfamily